MCGPRQVFGRNAGAARRPLSRPCSAPSSTRQAENFRTLVLISVASVFGAILTHPSAYGCRQRVGYREPPCRPVPLQHVMGCSGLLSGQALGSGFLSLGNLGPTTNPGLSLMRHRGERSLSGSPNPLCPSLSLAVPSALPHRPDGIVRPRAARRPQLRHFSHAARGRTIPSAASLAHRNGCRCSR